MALLPPLITVDDLEEYGYAITAESKIARASARARRYTGQNITTGSSTVILYGVGPWLMPQRPVTAITSVTDADGNVLVADEDYELRGQSLHASSCAPLTVVYTHGFATLPDDLIETVCAITDRLADLPAGMAQGARSEQAGGEMVTWGVEAFQAASGLTPAEEKALDKIYPRRPRTAILI